MSLKTLLGAHSSGLLALGMVLGSLMPFSNAQAQAQVQEWPQKPVKVIVPFPPGGGTDTVARPLAAKLTQMTGHQFVLDNRGGAGGTIGALAAAKSAPDGYTVLLAPVHVAVAVTAYKNLQYDLERFATRHHRRCLPRCAGGRHACPRQEPAGVDFFCQSQRWQDQLRLCWQRHHTAPVLRNVQCRRWR